MSEIATAISKLCDEVDDLRNKNAALEAENERLAAEVERMRKSLEDAARLLKTLRPNSNGWDCDEDSACDWIDAFINQTGSLLSAEKVKP